MSQAAIALQQVRKVSGESISLSKQAKQLLGVNAIGEEPLPGKDASSRRLRLKSGKSMIATHRKYPGRVDPECLILESFTAHKVATPHLLGKHQNGLFLHQDLDGPSVVQRLVNAKPGEYAPQILPALKNLVKLHRVGSHEAFEAKLPVIGDSEAWLREFVHYPAKMGSTLGIKPQAPDIQGLLELLAVKQPRFIKWNARPTTTRLIGDQVYWVDWDRSAVRQRMDDLVWFFGDETLPEWPDEEERLLKAFLPYFADGMSDAEAKDYFYCFGVLHLSVRLGLLLRRKQQMSWQSTADALRHPECGLHKPWVINLCRRGQRWAGESDLIRPLGAWFVRIEEAVNRMS